MESIITNQKNYDNGLISFTRKITWLAGLDVGWGNGYVGVPEGNRLYGKEYDELNKFIDIHYGLTYSRQETIDDKDYWVFGFDTAHLNDSQYNRPETWVIAETESLYNQIKEHAE